MSAEQKVRKLKRRHRRVRKKVFGTPERPRLAVYRSTRHIYAQLIDDVSGHTLASASSLKDTDGEDAKAIAKAVGVALAQRAKKAGVTQVAFDRGGFKFHGRVAKVAEGAREGGLDF
jgi:large subunit ribosomal protein L18